MTTKERKALLKTIAAMEKSISELEAANDEMEAFFVQLDLDCMLEEANEKRGLTGAACES